MVCAQVGELFRLSTGRAIATATVMGFSRGDAQSPVDAMLLEALFSSHPSRALVRFLWEGFTFGFCVRAASRTLTRGSNGSGPGAHRGTFFEAALSSLPMLCGRRSRQAQQPPQSYF